MCGLGFEEKPRESNDRKSPDVEIKCSTPKEDAYIQHSCKYF